MPVVGSSPMHPLQGCGRSAVPGAATGANTEAACPNCKACRTALGGRCRDAADHTRSGAERRARTTADAIVAAAQNGTSASAPGLKACSALSGLTLAANRRSRLPPRGGRRT